MLGPKTYRSMACGAMAVFGIAIAAGQQVARTGPYTAEQANAGRAAYQATCAGCHMPDLHGSNEATPLAGNNFVNAWRNRTTSDLFNRIRNTMPAGNPGSLGEQDAVNIVAYILQVNGASAGTQALTPATLVPIGAVANGEATTAQPPTAGAAPATQTAAPPRSSGRPAGLTVAGEVKN